MEELSKQDRFNIIDQGIKLLPKIEIARKQPYFDINLVYGVTVFYNEISYEVFFKFWENPVIYDLDWDIHDIQIN